MNPVTEGDVIKEQGLTEQRNATEAARHNTHTQHPLQQRTLATLGAASALLGDDQGARRAGGARAQITSHLGITAFTLPATAVGPTSQVLEEERMKEEERKRECIIRPGKYRFKLLLCAKCDCGGYIYRGWTECQKHQTTEGFNFEEAESQSKRKPRRRGTKLNANKPHVSVIKEA